MKESTKALISKIVGQLLLSLVVIQLFFLSHNYFASNYHITFYSEVIKFPEITLIQTVAFLFMLRIVGIILFKHDKD
jgi:hypothetical protein